MSLNKSVISKALCISAICCILVSNVSFAKTLEKECVKAQECNCSIEDLDNLKAQYYQADRTDTQTVLSLLDKISCISNKLNGEISDEAFYNAINYANVYGEIKKASLQKQYLDKAKVIADKLDNNKDLLRDYYENLSNFYSNYEDHYRAVKALKEARKHSSDPFFGAGQIANSYIQLKDFKNAQQELNNQYKSLKANKDTQNYEYLGYYCSLIDLNINRGNFQKAYVYYNEAKKLLDKFEPNNHQLNSSLNSSLINYYKEYKDINNQKNYIDKNLKIAQTNNDLFGEFYANNDYLDYYSSIHDYKSVKSYIKQREKLTTKLYNDEYMIKSNLYPSYIDYYNNIGNTKKAEKYAIENVNISKQFEQSAPIMYANALSKLAEIKRNGTNKQDALKLHEEAQAIYKTIYPEISYKLYESENEFGNDYSSLAQPEKAFSYYIKAENILKKAVQEPIQANIDSSSSLAYMHADLDNLNESIKNIDKAIQTSTKIYGPTHIKTANLYLWKAGAYQNRGMYDLANETEKELNKIIASGIIGYRDDFDYNYYNYLTNKYIANNNYDKALEAAKKLKPAAQNDWQKDNADFLISIIYKEQGKKIKALTHSVKSKI